MRYDDKTRPAPTRGILIVDACFLFDLCAVLPQWALTPLAAAKASTVRLTDALFFLAQQGFEVIVPEMVALESGHMLRDGQSINQYFDNSSSLPYEKDFHAILPHVLGSPDNITIMPPTPDDHSESAKYVRDMWMIHTMGVDGKADEKKLADIQNRIKRLQRTDTKHFGEQAAFELIKRLSESDLPVFFLSADRDAQEKVVKLRPDLNVQPVSTMDFYGGLRDAGLLKQIGVGDVPEEQMRIELDFICGRRKGNLSKRIHIPERTDNPAFANALVGMAAPVRSIANLLKRRNAPEPGPDGSKT